MSTPTAPPTDSRAPPPCTRASPACPGRRAGALRPSARRWRRWRAEAGAAAAAQTVGRGRRNRRGVGATDEGKAPYPSGIVQIFADHAPPDFVQPWQRDRQYSSTSTGFVVDSGKRWLITNAHAVEYAEHSAKVKRRGLTQRHDARVLAVSAACDLALLTVDDDAFWGGENAPPSAPAWWRRIVADADPDAAPPPPPPPPEPVVFADALPRLGEAVSVVGHPVGGDELCITTGVVSRVGVSHYSYGSRSLLCLQTDAAINAGNSGGPVFSEERTDRFGRWQCVGVAFQALRDGGDTEGVGYVIPTEIVRHFIEDCERNACVGELDGFPSLGIAVQSLENASLRLAVTGREPDASSDPQYGGVLVRSVAPGSAAARGDLRSGDVLVEVQGCPVGFDGTVPLGTDVLAERVPLSHPVSLCTSETGVNVTVLRGGEPMELTFDADVAPIWVPRGPGTCDPPYLVLGGFVFLVLSEAYLVSAYGEDWSSDAPLHLLRHYDVAYPPEEHARPVGLAAADEQPPSAVLLACALPGCAATSGYEAVLGTDAGGGVVTEVDGVPVRNLEHLALCIADAVRAGRGLGLTLSVDGPLGARGYFVHVDASSAASSTSSLVDREGMACALSPSLARLSPFLAASLDE